MAELYLHPPTSSWHGTHLMTLVTSACNRTVVILMYRSVWVLCIQVHPIWANQRSVTVPVATSSREQGRPEEDQEGEDVAAARAPPQNNFRPDLLQAQRQLRPRVKAGRGRSVSAAQCQHTETRSHSGDCYMFSMGG